MVAGVGLFVRGDTQPSVEEQGSGEAKKKRSKKRGQGNQRRTMNVKSHLALSITVGSQAYSQARRLKELQEGCKYESH